MCVSLLPFLQVVLDSQPPEVSLLQVAVAATAESPFFQLLVRFSEPVSWLANRTTTSSSSAAGNSPAGSTDSTGGSGQQVSSATYSSSRLLLTNAALGNISMVAGSAVVLATGEGTNAATAFVLWFKSWGGAEATVEILGAAYQDVAGNKGQQDTALQVQYTAC
jgi:hypothetical protein